MPISSGGNRSVLPPSAKRSARFIRIPVPQSAAARMLHDCSVVSAGGRYIGQVSQLMVDVETMQLCYVLLDCRKGRHVSEVAIPWRALYFDSSRNRLVFYTAP